MALYSLCSAAISSTPWKRKSAQNVTQNAENTTFIPSCIVLTEEGKIFIETITNRCTGKALLLDHSPVRAAGQVFRAKSASSVQKNPKNNMLI